MSVVSDFWSKFCLLYRTASKVVVKRKWGDKECWVGWYTWRKVEDREQSLKEHHKKNMLRTEEKSFNTERTGCWVRLKPVQDRAINSKPRWKVSSMLCQWCRIFDQNFVFFTERRQSCRGAWYSIKIHVIFGVQLIKSKPTQKLKHANPIVFWIYLPNVIKVDLYKHWIPVRRRVDFKMTTLVYVSQSGMAPAYLAADCK